MDTVVVASAAGVAGLVVGGIVGYVMGKSHTANGDSGDGNATGAAGELYVGNLPYSMGERELRELFGKHGRVASVRLIKNRANGRSRGYGFVSFDDAAAATSAVKAINGESIGGRKLVVKEARSDSRDRE